MLFPAADQRTNRGTWWVPTEAVPAVAAALVAALPAEAYDPAFRGQDLETTYFDTAGFDLRRARKRGDAYLTLRLRRYAGHETYALSAKTEAGKYRIAVDPARADFLLHGGVNAGLPDLLPADLLGRVVELTGGAPLAAVVAVRFRRYAVEDGTDRLTLDVDVRSDAGRAMPAHVLEYKSTADGGALPPGVAALAPRPTRMSKFLWATCT